MTLSCFVGGFNLVVHCGLPANVQVLDHTSAVTLQSLFTTLTTTTQPNIKSSKSAKIEHDYKNQSLDFRMAGLKPKAGVRTIMTRPS